MVKQRQRFRISTFTNPSGDRVHRVSGTLNGERIRQNFRTREEAEAARQKLDSRFLNEQEHGRTIWTTLSHDQNQDAVAAVSLLRKAKSSKSLTFAVEFFLRHYRESAEEKRPNEAVKEYLDEKSRDQTRGVITQRQYRGIRMELNRFKQEFGDLIVGEVEGEQINLETSVIRIVPEVSKVHEMRSIQIQPNLGLWLKKYPPSEFPIVPKSRFREMRLDIRDRFKLGHDILRHTFISMLVGAFRSVGDAALQAGNSEAIIRKQYLDLKSVSEADKFWQIRPAGTELPEKFEKKDGRYVYGTS